MPEDKQLISGEPGFQPRQSGSRAHALNKYYAMQPLHCVFKQRKVRVTPQFSFVKFFTLWILVHIVNIFLLRLKS